MSHELHYTSVPRGLKPGSRGFCTVGMTPQMPGPLVDRLESLSGYQPVFPPHDASAPLNPIVFSHLRLTIGGKMVSVLSRIGPAGLDYSGRPNKYAHHVVLDGTERPDGGPAWLLSQPGFMQSSWNGEPREISVGRNPPQGDPTPGLARAWHSLTGDGGWAGVLAESFLADSRRTVFLVFRPGMDILPLFVEALALLPASRRWDVDFSTYFNQLPQGVTCAWRGVLEGSDDARNARPLPNAIDVDLCNGLGAADGGVLVHLARTGERLATPDTPTTMPARGRHIPRMARDPSVASPEPLNQTGALRPRDSTKSYELIPELARPVSAANFSATEGNARLNRSRRNRYWIGVAMILACVVPLFAIPFLFDGGTIAQKLDLKSEVVAEAVRKSKEDENKVEFSEISVPPETDRLKLAREPSPSPVPKDQKGIPPSEVTADAQKNEGATAQSSIPLVPNPDAEKRKIIEPAIVFYPLPKLPVGSVSVFGPVMTRTHDQRIPALSGDISGIKLLAAGSLDLQPGSLEAGREIRTTAVGGPVAIARFKAENDRLQFDWLGETRQENKSTNALRDGILSLPKADQENYILLRELGTADFNAFDLTNKPEHEQFRPLLDDYKHRELSFPWADKDALAGTNWKLVIRGWKIVSRFDAAGPETVIAEAKNAENWLENVNEPIIPNEVMLKIAIDSPENPHLIKVRFDFHEEEIKNKKNERETTEFEIQRLRRKEEKDQSEKESLKQLEKQEKHIYHINNLYNAVLKSRYARLSLVVGLKIDSSRTVDIAMFQESALKAH
jgi:hypothetical protein